MSILKIKEKKYWGGGVKRVIEVTPLVICGDLADVPVNKTYQNSHRLPRCVVKLNINENGFITQRIHYLYKSSKKGYYCVVCKNKVYFTDDEIKRAKVVEKW